MVPNRVNLVVGRKLLIYRKSWKGTGALHRDGRRVVGMGDHQLCDGQGQEKHIYPAMMANSLLRRKLRHCRAHDWVFQKLMTIGEACRGLLSETLRSTLPRAKRQVTEFSSSSDQVIQKLGMAMVF